MDFYPCGFWCKVVESSLWNVAGVLLSLDKSIYKPQSFLFVYMIYSDCAEIHNQKHRIYIYIYIFPPTG